MTKATHTLVSLCVLVGAFALCVVPAVAAESPGSCPNEHLRSEQPFASGLPDCRAYEMVSPVGKGDDGVSSVSSRAAASGEAVSYFSRGSFADPMSALLEGRYLSRRGADGWSTRNISPPYTDFETNALSPSFEALLFTEDLSRGLVQSLDTPLVGGESAGYINLYVADLEDGSYRAVSDVTPETEVKPFTEEASPLRPQAEGASSDLSSVVFSRMRVWSRARCRAMSMCMSGRKACCI